MMNNNGMKFLAHQKAVGGPQPIMEQKKEIVGIDYWNRQEKSAK